jgi:signal transduction histidine kinase
VGKILAKAEYTMNFVKDYLNLAKAENSAENLKKKKTDVGHLLEAALDMAEPAFDEKNMRPRNYSAGQPFTAECEPGLIGVVFNNLINNSIKYGFEKTEVQCVLKTADNKLFFSIRNEGPGFPKSEKGKLFRKFSRISSPEFKDVPGTGVGLYTVWKIINMHGGGISASSEPGKWAQFEFEIPRGKI